MCMCALYVSYTFADGSEINIRDVAPPVEEREGEVQILRIFERGFAPDYRVAAGSGEREAAHAATHSFISTLK